MDIQLHQNVTGSYKKKCAGTLVELQDRQNIKRQRYRNSGENYLTNARLNLRTSFVWEKKKNTMASEMSWQIALRRTGTDFCVIDNSGSFANFRVLIFTQERISTYVNLCP